MFGLLCEENKENDKNLTRHLFGKDSFESEETFDTLIPCDKCLALDALPSDAGLEAKVDSLHKDVDGIKTGMAGLEEKFGALVKEVTGEDWPKEKIEETKAE